MTYWNKANYDNQTFEIMPQFTMKLMDMLSIVFDRLLHFVHIETVEKDILKITSQQVHQQ